MSESTVLAVDDLSVDLGGTEILSDVSLTAAAGELVGLIGPNGAGKTTLLRAIRGSVQPTTGTVTVDGQPVADLSARQTGRLVATVPQETRLSFSFSVQQAVTMGRNPHIGRFGTADDTDRKHVEKAIEHTSLSAFTDRPVTELSGGERQRVLLARALAQDTPLLLLDEPTANLDINHAINTLDLVRSVVDDGTAAVAAIHDLNLAARYCDRLVLVASGSVLASGAPETVLTRETLREAFDARTVVSEDPTTDSPRVTALSEQRPVDDGQSVDYGHIDDDSHLDDDS
jgi:iron complex transport system ATP-binding protein